MKKLIIGLIALAFSVVASAQQFSTPATAKNTDPLSKISKVQFDSLTKVITVFDGQDSWDFKPVTAYPMKSGYEVTGKSGFEKLYFVLRYSGKEISQITAYDAKSYKQAWAMK